MVAGKSTATHRVIGWGEVEIMPELGWVLGGCPDANIGRYAGPACCTAWKHLVANTEPRRFDTGSDYVVLRLRRRTPNAPTAPSRASAPTIVTICTTDR